MLSSKKPQRSSACQQNWASPIKEENEARPSSGRSRAKALAGKFRNMANNCALVKELQKARNNGMLLKRAKELLEDGGENSSD